MKPSRGKQASIAAYILKNTNNGQELVDRLLEIARTGRLLRPSVGFPGMEGYKPAEHVDCEPKDVIKSVEILFDRSTGRPSQEINLSESKTIVKRDFSRLSEQELETFAALERKTVLAEGENTDDEPE